jgi:hypothetical protein
MVGVVAEMTRYSPPEDRDTEREFYETEYEAWLADTSDAELDELLDEAARATPSGGA